MRDNRVPRVTDVSVIAADNGWIVRWYDPEKGYWGHKVTQTDVGMLRSVLDVLAPSRIARHIHISEFPCREA